MRYTPNMEKNSTLSHFLLDCVLKIPEYLLNNSIPTRLSTTKTIMITFQPSTLGYEISPTASITLGYNRRISRPNAWTLNPFQSRSSKTSYFQGNPKLDPSYSNGIDIGYLKQFKKVTLNTSVYYPQVNGCH